MNYKKYLKNPVLLSENFNGIKKIKQNDFKKN